LPTFSGSRSFPKAISIPKRNDRCATYSENVSTWSVTGPPISSSIKNIVSRNMGITMKSDDIKTMTATEVEGLFREPHLYLSIMASLTTVQHLTSQVRQIEKTLLGQIRLRDDFKGLLRIPGIGIILGLTIMLEVGDIRRFEGVGNYASYCRCVQSVRRSNDKKTGEGNRKNGNKYLSWAYVEAANIAKRHPTIKRYYEKKAARTKNVVAIKAVAHKLARASYYVLRDRAVFDERRLFG
jgi:transposase